MDKIWEKHFEEQTAKMKELAEILKNNIGYKWNVERKKDVIYLTPSHFNADHDQFFLDYRLMKLLYEYKADLHISRTSYGDSSLTICIKTIFNDKEKVNFSIKSSISVGFLMF